MIIGFRADDCDLIPDVLNELSISNNYVDVGNSLKDSSKRMVEFTSGKPFSSFNWVMRLHNDAVIYMIKLEFRKINPKIDYFFNLLTSLFGLNNFCRFAIKKMLKKKGYVGSFEKVNDQELLELFAWGE